MGVLFDEIEEKDAVLDDEVDVGDEGSEAVGSAVGFEVESEAGEAVLGEEDWGGLERPADVVAVAVDHEDDATWRVGDGEPLAGEELDPSWGGVEGFRGFDSLQIVVVLLWGVAPVVRELDHPALFFLHFWKCFFNSLHLCRLFFLFIRGGVFDLVHSHSFSS